MWATEKKTFRRRRIVILNIVSLTDIGLIRSSNQDSFKTYFMSSDIVWAVVCDGMGGANGGSIASELAVNIISESIKLNYNENMTDEETKNILISAAYQANNIIYEKALTDASLMGMGTTVVAAIVKPNKIHLINAGDSRAYLITNTEVTQITKDHSIVQDMLDHGEITSNEAKNHPRKNIITRALGADKFIDVDYFEVTFDEDNTLLMCTDGFSNYMENDKIFTLAKNTNFEFLAREAVALAKGAGGSDNITVVAISR